MIVDPDQKAQSILGAERLEAYNSGWSQAAQISFDDAYDKGLHDGRSEHPRRFVWWLIGCFCGGIAFFLTGYF